MGLTDLVQMVPSTFPKEKYDPLGLNPVTTEIPAGMRKEAKAYRDRVVEIGHGLDDTIAHKFLAGEHIGSDELMLAVRKATISLGFCGVVPGSAFKKKGVQRLLDCVVN